MKYSDKLTTIDRIRAFNRYYTGLLGLLEAHLLNSEYSLAEARILYEIYIHQPVSARQIISLVNIDKGYLSRLLKLFEKKNLISKEISPEDARVTLLSLNKKGNKAFEILNISSNEQIEKLIDGLNEVQQNELVKHMEAITRLLTHDK